MTTQNPHPASRMTDAARERIRQDLACGGDGTNPTFTFSCTSSAVLLAFADGQIDPLGLALDELVNRGVSLTTGEWVGVESAREIRLGTATANGADIKSGTAADQAVAEIARRILRLDTIETRNADGLDFPERAVWSIRDALLAAYAAGASAAAARREG